jgi:hypothetical protein
LEAFEYAAPFDPSMMVYFRKRLLESVVNDCKEQIIRHSLAVIQSTASKNDQDADPGGGAVNSGDQQESRPEVTDNQGSLLNDATCKPADIRYTTDLSLLNEAREVTEKLIDAVRGKSRCYVEFRTIMPISGTGYGFTLLDRLSFDPYNDGDDLKAQVLACRRCCGQYPAVDCADQIYRTCSKLEVTFREGVTPWLPLRRPESIIARGSVRALLMAC